MWFSLIAMHFLAISGCAPRPAGVYQGYVEGEFVYVAAPLGGMLTNLAVSRGSEVGPAALLFQLEGEAERAAVREAMHRLEQARARLANLGKGRRPSEIAALEAQLDRARANLRLSEQELARRQRLADGRVIAQEELDLSVSRRDADRAQVATLTAEIETARLAARADEIKGAEAEVEAAGAAFARAEWALAQKTQYSPTNAWVQDTLYRQGEWVAAGSPVVVLLPPENLKARFFVPQPALAAVRLGQPITVTIDGGATPFTARINYVSTRAEFTPPVIYSKENRAKLVYMVEAAFRATDAAALRPGQPIDVRLVP